MNWHHGCDEVAHARHLRGGITMFWKLFSFCGLLLLVGALALATAESAQAQHRGGGHGGGFHSGGFHSGGFHSGGFHAGGSHRGSFYGGYYHTYPRSGYWGNHHYHRY